MKLAKTVEIPTHIFMALRHVGAKRKNNIVAHFRRLKPE
jgi:hypothetical protein